MINTFVVGVRKVVRYVWLAVNQYMKLFKSVVKSVSIIDVDYDADHYKHSVMECEFHVRIP